MNGPLHRASARAFWAFGLATIAPTIQCSGEDPSPFERMQRAGASALGGRSSAAGDGAAEAGATTEGGAHSSGGTLSSAGRGAAGAGSSAGAKTGSAGG